MLFRSEATKNGLGPQQILDILPFVVPSLLPFSIPATYLLTICVVYGRLAGDNEITAVKAERVNQISEADALAEGVKPSDALEPHHLNIPPMLGCVAGFHHLWNSIQQKPGTRFEDGPWVWAYTFRRVK